ncbi:MAG TPA: hypothetical protein VFU71_09900 [Burkholderiaceae bacterium]|nr:hypothetical protein [Burkholderiaceae bacterium]
MPKNLNPGALGSHLPGEGSENPAAVLHGLPAGLEATSKTVSLDELLDY